MEGCREGWWVERYFVFTLFWGCCLACGASSPHQIRSDTNISDYVFFVYLFLGITALFSLNWLLITIKP